MRVCCLNKAGKARVWLTVYCHAAVQVTQSTAAGTANATAFPKCKTILHSRPSAAACFSQRRPAATQRSYSN